MENKKRLIDANDIVKVQNLYLASGAERYYDWLLFEKLKREHGLAA